MRRWGVVSSLGFLCGAAIGWAAWTPAIGGGGGPHPHGGPLDHQLRMVLDQAGFTGRIESTLETRLGRPVDPELADLGRLLFFDHVLGLHGDNSCAGCHAPAVRLRRHAVDRHRRRQQPHRRARPRTGRATSGGRRCVSTPRSIPKLMWNGRFVALSGDPFDNSQGFPFPPPEGTTRSRRTTRSTHLLVAQGAHPADRAGGDGGLHRHARARSARLRPVRQRPRRRRCRRPTTAASATSRSARPVLRGSTRSPSYRRALRRALQRGVPPAGADRLLDVRRGRSPSSSSRSSSPTRRSTASRAATARAMTTRQKRGALLFFGKAGCVQCHAVAGARTRCSATSRTTCIGVPQIAPEFGVGEGT